LLAKDVNDNACFLSKRGACGFFREQARSYRRWCEVWRRQVDELALGKKVSLTSSHAVISIGKQLIGHLDDFALRIDELAHSGATRS